MAENSRALAAAAALISGLWVAGAAHATEEAERDKNVIQLAVNELLTAVAVSDREASAACVFGLVLFDHTTATGRVWYATLLEALDTGAAIDLIYDRSGDRCQLKQLHIR